MFLTINIVVELEAVQLMPESELRLDIVLLEFEVQFL